MLARNNKSPITLEGLATIIDELATLMMGEFHRLEDKIDQNTLQLRADIQNLENKVGALEMEISNLRAEIAEVFKVRAPLTV